MKPLTQLTDQEIQTRCAEWFTRAEGMPITVKDIYIEKVEATIIRGFYMVPDSKEPVTFSLTYRQFFQNLN